MIKVTIDTERSNGCGLSANAFPKGIITLNGKTLISQGYHPAEVTEQEKCIACAMCALMCPHVVIRVERDV